MYTAHVSGSHCCSKSVRFLIHSAAYGNESLLNLVYDHSINISEWYNEKNESLYINFVYLGVTIEIKALNRNT